MRKLFLILVLIGCITAFFEAQQRKNAAASSAPKGDISAALHARAEALLAAYSAKDVGKARTFYDTDPQDVFFDIQPLEFHGIDEYAKASQQGLNQMYRTVQFRLRDDFKVHPMGNSAWTTATAEMGGTRMDGNKVSGVARWTAIWRNESGKWLIVHEHVSFPSDMHLGDARMDVPPQK